MKKFFIAVAIAASFLMANETAIAQHIDMPKQGQTFQRKTSVDDSDTLTSVTTTFGGKEYPVYLNKNKKAFIVAEKKDGTGTYIKWLGPEMTAKVIEAMKK